MNLPLCRASFLVVFLVLNCFTYGKATTAGAVGNHGRYLLMGTVITPTQPKAIFRDRKGVDHLLAQQDKIGNCVIDRIVPKRAVLVCRDSRQVLALDNGQGAAFIERPENHEEAMISYYHYVSRKKLDRLVENRQRLVTQVSLIPVVRDGSMYGYRIADLQAGGELDRFGLVNDDVVIAVNGTPASQPESFIAAIKILDSMAVISLEIKRKARSLVLNYILH